MKLKQSPRLVFVCSPLRAPTAAGMKANITKAYDYCRVVLAAGHVPYGSHMFYPYFLDDTLAAERELGMACGLAELARRDELWFWGYPSSGMRTEILHAKSLGKAVYMYDDEHPEDRIGAFKRFEADGSIVLNRDLVIPPPCVDPKAEIRAILNPIILDVCKSMNIPFPSAATAA